MFRTKVLARAILLLTALLLLYGCNTGKAEVVAYLDAAGPLLDEWRDCFDRAASTSRIALSSVIGELQAIRRKYSALPVPEPCANMHTNVVNSMNYSIEGFFAFMEDKNEAEITSIFKLANHSLDYAMVNLKELVSAYQ